MDYITTTTLLPPTGSQRNSTTHREVQVCESVCESVLRQTRNPRSPHGAIRLHPKGASPYTLTLVYY